MTMDIKINADPESNARCKFTVDRPVCPDSAYYFDSSERAQGSPFAERMFQIPTVTGVLISHERVTVTKSGREEWPVTAKQVGAAIRAHLATGQPAVSDAMRAAIPLAAEIQAKVRQVLEKEINPMVAAHGGQVSLLGVKGNTVYLKLGGGCQGCGQADVTLKQGIEKSIRFAAPEVGDILDTTDHAAGRNPYYTPSAK